MLEHEMYAMPHDDDVRQMVLFETPQRAIPRGGKEFLTWQEWAVVDDLGVHTFNNRELAEASVDETIGRSLYVRWVTMWYKRGDL